MKKFLCILFSLVFLLSPTLLVYAVSETQYDEEYINNQLLHFFEKDSHIAFSPNSRIEIEYSNSVASNNQQGFITITETIDSNKYRKTVVVPYEDSADGLKVLDPQKYLSQISNVIMGGKVVNPPYSFNGLVLYLSCYYQHEYYAPYAANCYRFNDLYAVATSGSSPVTNFKFEAHALGIKVLLNPYREIQESFQYMDRLSVSTMQIGSQYSKICHSIAPYYISTRGGQPATYADLLWEGTYNGKNFYSGYGFPVY